MPRVPLDLGQRRDGKDQENIPLERKKRRAPMSTSLAGLRVATACERCKTHLIAPVWSETVNERQTVHIWSCPICGNEFQTVDDRPEPVLSDDELAQEFLPNLLVA
jgi:hypothetical protein